MRLVLCVLGNAIRIAKEHSINKISIVMIAGWVFSKLSDLVYRTVTVSVVRLGKRGWNRAQMQKKT